MATLSLNGGALTGVGNVGPLTAVAGGTVAPGNGPGVLTAASVNFNAATTLRVELNGPTPGNGPGHYDQLVVNGTVALGGANLVATLGYAADPSTSFTILRSIWAISGAFAQGSTVTIGGRLFQIIIDNTGTDQDGHPGAGAAAGG